MLGRIRGSTKATLRHPHQEEALHPESVDERLEVVHLRLEGVLGAVPIRQPRPVLVERNEPQMLGQRLDEQRRRRPEEPLEVRRPPYRHHQRRSFTRRRVREGHPVRTVEVGEVVLHPRRGYPEERRRRIDTHHRG